MSWEYYTGDALDTVGYYCHYHYNDGSDKKKVKLITETRYGRTLIDLGHSYYTSIFHCTILWHLKGKQKGLLGICKACYDNYSERKYSYQRRTSYGKEINRTAKHIEKVLNRNAQAENIRYLVAWLFDEPKYRGKYEFEHETILVQIGDKQFELGLEVAKEYENENKRWPTDYDPKVSLKSHEGCKLFRCLKCWKVIFPDDDMLESGDGYVHALCDPEAFKKRKEQWQIERDRQRYTKLLNTARVYAKQSGKPVEVELRKLLYKELPKKAKAMCANKGCPHIREKHRKGYAFGEDGKRITWYGICTNPACSCEQFKERKPKGKQIRKVSLSLPWRD